MQTLSEFIGKPLLTKAGEQAGTIKNALLSKNLKAVRAFEYFDEQEDEHELPVGAIASAEDALIARSLVEKPCKDAMPAPFGIAVYSETGETLGNVCDFVLDGYTVAALRLADGKEIEAARIASVKDALIADLRSPLPLKPARPARSKAKPAPNPPKAVQAAPAQPAPKAGSALLTGRRAPADVTDARGNVIVEKDTVITAEVLRRAMAHNKLFELTLSVLSVQ